MKSSIAVIALRRVAETAARIPSAGYALAYLAAIPTFAFLYFAVPDDFYHGAARYDTTVIQQTEALAERLRRTYLAEAGLPIEKPASLRERIFGAPPPPRRRFRIVLDPYRIQVRVEGEFPRRDKRGAWWFGTASLDLGELYFRKLSPQGNWATQVVEVQVKPEILEGPRMDLSTIFPCRNGFGTCLRMTGEDCVSLTEFQEVAAGHLTDEQSSYFRMLYFSAVTITTLGYGDIVPVTSFARALVTIEVIVGPLLFALFLNSLVKEGATRSQAWRKMPRAKRMQRSTFLTEPLAVSRKRHGCLTAILVAFGILSGLTAIGNLSFSAPIASVLPNAPTWAAQGVFAMGALGLVMVFALAGVWFWKKWAVFLYIATTLLIFAINIRLVGVPQSFLGFIGVTLLSVFVVRQWKEFR